MDLRRSIEQHKVIAILRRVPEDRAVPVARALYEGGIRLLEITFDQQDEPARTAAMIANVKDTLPDLSVGAGTVMTTAQVSAAVSAGASFALAPNTDPRIIEACKERALGIIPGAFTPTEIVTAYRLGADVVKVFPASILGPAYLKAIRSPISHIPMIAVGGVGLGNLADFLRAGVIGAGIGGSLSDPKLIQNERYDELTALARRFMEVANGNE